MAFYVKYKELRKGFMKKDKIAFVSLSPQQSGIPRCFAQQYQGGQNEEKNVGISFYIDVGV